MARLILLVALAANVWAADVVIRPREYTEAFPNPLKGFRPSTGRAKAHPFATVAKHYIRWNELEESAGDGVEKIRAFCDKSWQGFADRNIKIIPRVYLEWPNRGTYWPSDMQQGDYTSAQFRERVVRLIEKLGAAWDQDPRVAFIEIGLIGRWGEHHHPEPGRDMQKLVGDAFTTAFPNKLLMNRYPWHFEDYGFGIYWDSFGHEQEAVRHLPALESPRLADRWKTAPMGGETAFDWGTPLGKDPTDAIVRNADHIIDLVRRLHWNHLGWLSDYDLDNAEAVANAARIQKAFGYRFVIDEVRYPSSVQPGEPFRVAFLVRNSGSTPFYYRWPVEVGLLRLDSGEPVWTGTFERVDVRQWLPGDTTYEAFGEFALPADIEPGEYALTLAILDPAGNVPAARFAIVNYRNGGRHPIGRIGIAKEIEAAELSQFDDLASDRSLRYLP